MRSELHLFETNPIIAAVKDERQLERTFALENDILFFLFGNICTIGTLVRRAKEAGKLAQERQAPPAPKKDAPDRGER